MKLNKIKSLCKAARRVIIYNELGEGGELRRQWIGTGTAMYILEGLPILGPGNIPVLLGLEGNALNKVKITQEKMPEDIFTGDYDAEEPALTFIPCTVNAGGRDLVLFRSQFQVWALSADELGPAYAQALTCKMRWTPDGVPYFVIFRGMFLTAILFDEQSRMLDEASRNGLSLWMNWLRKTDAG